MRSTFFCFDRLCNNMLFTCKFLSDINLYRRLLTCTSLFTVHSLSSELGGANTHHTSTSPSPPPVQVGMNPPLVGPVSASDAEAWSAHSGCRERTRTVSWHIHKGQTPTSPPPPPPSPPVMMLPTPHSASACCDLPCVKTLAHYATGQRG